MNDPQLKALVERIGYDEGIPVVVDPKILSPMNFIHEVIDRCFPNPFIPDTPQRIATDTSQKIPVRYGETIKSYIARPDLDPASLTYIPLAIAGWLRYLLAVDDKGEPMTCSAAPMLDTLQEQLSGVKLGQPETASDAVLAPILSNKALFAVDLCEIGLATKIGGMLREELAGPGAVRSALERYFSCALFLFDIFRRSSLASAIELHRKMPNFFALQILCLNGCILICQDSALTPDELAAVLEQLRTADELTAALPDSPEQVCDQLEGFINRFQEGADPDEI